jgi:hypothetical protein
MGSLIEELKRREAVARAEADRLRSRIGELSEDLARAEGLTSRLALAGRKSCGCWQSRLGAGRWAGRQASGEGRAGPADRAVTVVAWQEGAEASVVLPRTYQDLLEVAADAGRPWLRRH